MKVAKKQNAEVVWHNEAGTMVDLHWVSTDGKEHFAFAVPPTGRRTWSSPHGAIWVARDHDSKILLPLNQRCRYTVPRHKRHLQTTITGN